MIFFLDHFFNLSEVIPFIINFKLFFLHYYCLLESVGFELVGFEQVDYHLLNFSLFSQKQLPLSKLILKQLNFYYLIIFMVINIILIILHQHYLLVFLQNLKAVFHKYLLNKQYFKLIFIRVQFLRYMIVKKVKVFKLKQLSQQDQDLLIVISNI